jgi:hypothetical protein
MLGALPSFISLSWGENYQNKGVFTLLANDTKENIELLKEGYYLYKAGKKTAMVIKYLKFDRDKQEIEVHGYTTLEIIDRRGLLGAKFIRNAEQDMKEALLDNLRGLQRISVSENKGFEETYNGQFSNHSFLEIFPVICSQTELGITMLFDHRNKQHIFEVYKGVDRTWGQRINTPVLFSDDWGNLQNTVIIDDNSLFKNVAYVFGAGEGAEREMVEVGTAQGDDRYELFVDARDLQPEEEQTIEEYRQILTTRGIAKLNEHIRRLNFSAEVDAADFGVKYDLGDKITAKNNKYGITLDTRIMQYNQIIENNMSRVQLTLGEPEITAIGELKIWANR